MQTKNEIIGHYQEYLHWVESLKSMDDRLWLEPIEPGKWSVGEIIAHLLFWNRFILEERFPFIKAGAQIASSVDGELKNSQASQYARSGISKDQLLAEWLETGSAFVGKLQEMPEELFSAEYRINQKPVTLSGYLAGMIEHDLHHQAQVAAFLQERSVN